jgi:hypothetical protein
MPRIGFFQEAFVDCDADFGGGYEELQLYLEIEWYARFPI